MHWRERLEQNPALMDLTTWPQLDPTLIKPEYRHDYARNIRITQAVLAGHTFRQVADMEKVSPGRISQLMTRCLGGDENKPPALRLGLIPHHIHPHHTSEDGHREGAFRRLLRDVPGLKLGLYQLALDRLKDRPFAGPLSPKRCHDEFKRLLASVDWPLDSYPYTTIDLAYESLRRYMGEVWQLHCQAKKVRRKGYRNRTPDITRSRIFERIEIDEYDIDCETRNFDIYLPLNDALPPMRIARMTLLCAIDTVSECILGYYLAPTGSASHLDILSLLSLALMPSSPRTLSHTKLAVPHGAGFPNWFDDIQLPVPAEIALDNAWCHHAGSVEAFVIDKLLANLSFGHPNNPTVRRCVEAVFNRLNSKLCHQLPSTTGSSVTDAKRESKKNRKKTPLVTNSEFEELLHVSLASFNGLPRPKFGGKTPLEVIRYQCAELYLPFVQPTTRANWAPFSGQQEVTVLGRSDTRARPYINFKYLKYTGPGLLAVPPSEKKIIIEFDRRDIRCLNASLRNGVSLGVLDCPPAWRTHPHSVATRRLLFTDYKKLVRRCPSPTTEFLAKKRREIASPTDVLGFLGIYQEFLGQVGVETFFGEIETLSLPEPDIEVLDHQPLSASTRPKPSKRLWSLDLNKQ